MTDDPRGSGREAGDDGPARARETVEEDLRSTSDSIRRRAARLADLEARKRDLPPDDPRVEELSDAAVDEAERIARETRLERELSSDRGD